MLLKKINKAGKTTVIKYDIGKQRDRTMGKNREVRNRST